MSGRHRKGGPPIDEPWAPEELVAPAPVAVAVQTVPAAPLVRPVADLAPNRAAPFAAPVGTGSAAEAAPVLPAGSSARKAAREQQRRRSRRARTVVAGLVALVVLVALVGGYRVWRGGSGAPDHQGTAARPQTTLLLQVVDGQGHTLDTVLLAHDSRLQGTGFGALVPSTLAVDSAGGAGTFGSIAPGGSGAAGDNAATALADLINVTVDGSWVLDTTGLAALVDAAGGVDLTVDRDLTVTVGAGEQTLASAGNQHLNGATAAAYATYLVSGEPEQSRLARFATVMGALLPRLPSSGPARAQLVTGLGTHSTSSLKAAALGDFLGAVRADAVADRLGFDTLPTHALDFGTGTPTLVVDPVGAATLVSSNFSGSLPASRPGGPISVVIQNGVGTPGLVAKARTRLLVGGITFVNGGNASKFGYAKSLVLVPNSSGQAGQAKGAAVAKALGLPASDVALTDQGQTIADVVVILGADFKP
jgi:LytR cell envelope-related transcriptional attenuator/LytR_cpsA_psr family